MQELRFQDHKISITSSQSRSSYGGGGAGAGGGSPDSVIFSNFSLFSSSASASVERCSSASDALDRDSIVSEMSLVIITLEITLNIMCYCNVQYF